MDDPTTSGTTEGFGLMFYNARWYDPSLGRFAQADTIVPDPYNTIDYDRYAYVDNNPIRYIDPSGHFKSDKELAKYLGFGSVDDLYKSDLWMSFVKAGILDQIRSEDFDFGNVITLEYDDGTIKNFVLAEGCFNSCLEHDLILYDADSGQAFTSITGYGDVFNNATSGTLFRPTSDKYDSFTFLSGNDKLPMPTFKEDWKQGEEGSITLHIDWGEDSNKLGAGGVGVGILAFLLTIADPPAGGLLWIALSVEGGGVAISAYPLTQNQKVPRFNFR